MKNILLFSLLLLTFNGLYAQGGVGIGVTTPQSSALLELSSTSKGLLIPRMTGAQRAMIGSPVAGLQVYQTNTELIPFSSPGLYVHNGTSWKRMARAEELTVGTSSWIVSGDNQYSSVDGNVGIGVTTGINDKLFIKGNVFITHVNGNDLVNGGNIAKLRIHGANTGSGVLEFLKPDTTAGGSIYYSSVGNVLNMRHATGTTFLRFYSSGNVGLGTGILSDEAMSKFHIKTGDFVDLNDNNGYLMMGSEGGLNIAMSNYEILARDNGATAPLYLQHDGGAVRIGNTGVTADTRLHITDGGESGLTTHGYMVLGLTTSGNMVFDPNEIQARSNGAATTLRLQQDGGALLVQGSALVVSSTGNVGIGDLTPDEKLHVAGNGLFNSTNPTIQLQNEGVDKGFFQLSGDNVRIGTNSANDLGNFVIRNNGADRVWVNPSGNMGIGVASPGSKLDVAGRINVSNNGEALKVDGVNPFIQLYQNGVAKSFLWQNGNHLQIGTSTGNSTGRILISAAEVAINTSGPAPGYSLSVGGEIICEELRVELQGNGPWPDYVFAEDYALRPIDELKSFIAANNHLPNIPPAAQVEHEGFDVGDMNRRLLEKVEELTLYIIQQQEEIDELKKRMDDKR